MIAAMMMLGTSAAFAGDSDQLKAILGAKDYASAAQLLQSNLSQLANPAEKAKAYNHLAKLALEVFDAQNLIVTENMAAQVNKSAVKPIDTLAFYESSYNATVNGVECVKYDAQPDEKGKVKPKFTATLSPLVANARLQLVTAGNYYAGKNDPDNVLKYWGTFLDTDDNPMFASTKASEQQFIGQVAYYTALYANQAKMYDKAEKYADIAMQDSSMRAQAETFKYQMAQRNLKTKADSLALIEKLKAAYAADNSNENVFGIICNLYTGLNMESELNAVIESAIAATPNNFTAWAMKGQTITNKVSKEQNPDYSEAIAAFKKALAIKPDNSPVLTYLGFALNNTAAAIQDDKAKRDALYQESLQYLEHARDVDPDRAQSNWAYPLFQSYYAVYGGDDSRTKEIESMIK